MGLTCSPICPMNILVSPSPVANNFLVLCKSKIIWKGQRWLDAITSHSTKALWGYWFNFHHLNTMWHFYSLSLPSVLSLRVSFTRKRTSILEKCIHPLPNCSWTQLYPVELRDGTIKRPWIFFIICEHCTNTSSSVHSWKQKNSQRHSCHSVLSLSLFFSPFFISCFWDAYQIIIIVTTFVF